MLYRRYARSKLELTKIGDSARCKVQVSIVTRLQNKTVFSFNDWTFKSEDGNRCQNHNESVCKLLYTLGQNFGL